MASLCRECLVMADVPVSGCVRCGSRRLICHEALDSLNIAHIDCDAFYASVEKRDRPDLVDKPVIIGGGRRGVVSAACYVARLYGVKSAMPMFKALDACPDAVVIPPDMAKYAAVGRQVRMLMRSVTRCIEPLSIDEAFLDLDPGHRLRPGNAAQSCAWLARSIEDQFGISASVGLSHNKFLAKLASDMDKPRGFSVIGRDETLDILAGLPTGKIWGVGAKMRARLAAEGIRKIGDIRAFDAATLVRRYGKIGLRLWQLAHGEDHRVVDPVGETKSVSAETTFERDHGDWKFLSEKLHHLSARVADRLARKDLAGLTVTLKLKTSSFDTLTRSRRHDLPVVDRTAIEEAGLGLLEPMVDGAARYRLIGIGVSDLSSRDVGDLLEAPGS